MMHSTDTSAIDLIKEDVYELPPNYFSSNRMSDTGSYEDWFGSEVVLPRSCDRILEQFVLMLLRIKVYLDKEGEQSVNSQMFNRKSSRPSMSNYEDIPCSSIATDDTDTPFQVGSSRYSNTASYLQEYPQIFMKKIGDVPRSDNTVESIPMQTREESEDNNNTTRSRKRIVTLSSNETVAFEEEKGLSQKKHTPEDKNRHERKLSQTASKEIANSLKEIRFKKSDSGTTSTSERNEEAAKDQQQENGSTLFDNENRSGNEGQTDGNSENKNKELSQNTVKSSVSDNEHILKEPSLSVEKSENNVKRNNNF